MIRSDLPEVLAFVLTICLALLLQGRHPNTFCGLVVAAAAAYQWFAGINVLFEVVLQCALKHFSAAFCTCLNSVHLAAASAVSHFYPISGEE